MKDFHVIPTRVSRLGNSRACTSGMRKEAATMPQLSSGSFVAMNQMSRADRNCIFVGPSGLPDHLAGAGIALAAWLLIDICCICSANPEAIPAELEAGGGFSISGPGGVGAGGVDCLDMAGLSPLPL